MFDYNEHTGVLIWKHREADMFPDGRKRNIFNAKFANKVAGTPHNGYLRLRIGGSLHLVHRIIWMMSYGEWPDNIDHVDHDRSNNKLSNLRNVTKSENAKNRSLNINNTSGKSGVIQDKRSGRWVCRLGANHGYVGSYQNIEDAFMARKQAEQSMGYHENHGEA